MSCPCAPPRILRICCTARTANPSPICAAIQSNSTRSAGSSQLSAIGAQPSPLQAANGELSSAGKELLPCRESYCHCHHPVVVRPRSRSRAPIWQPHKTSAFAQQLSAHEPLRLLYQCRIKPSQCRWSAQGCCQPPRLSAVPSTLTVNLL